MQIDIKNDLKWFGIETGNDYEQFTGVVVGRGETSVFIAKFEDWRFQSFYAVSASSLTEYEDGEEIDEENFFRLAAVFNLGKSVVELILPIDVFSISSSLNYAQGGKKIVSISGDKDEDFIIGQVIDWSNETTIVRPVSSSGVWQHVVNVATLGIVKIEINEEYCEGLEKFLRTRADYEYREL